MLNPLGEAYLVGLLGLAVLLLRRRIELVRLEQGLAPLRDGCTFWLEGKIRLL